MSISPTSPSLYTISPTPPAGKAPSIFEQMIQSVNSSKNSMRFFNASFASPSEQARAVAITMHAQQMRDKIDKATSPKEALALAICSHRHLFLMAQKQHIDIPLFYTETVTKSGKLVSLAGNNLVFICNTTRPSIAEIQEELKQEKATAPQGTQRPSIQILSNEENDEAVEEADKLDESFVADFNQLYDQTLQVLTAMQSCRLHRREKTSSTEPAPHEPLPEKNKADLTTDLASTPEQIQAKSEQREWQEQLEKLFHSLSAEKKELFLQVLKSILQSEQGYQIK